MTFLGLIIVIVKSLFLQKKLKSPLIYSITGSFVISFLLFILFYHFYRYVINDFM